MGWQYENLTNEELQRIANARFGSVLRPLREIGREAVIIELLANDRLQDAESSVNLHNCMGGSQ